MLKRAFLWTDVAVASYRETLLGKGLKPSGFCLSDRDGYVLFVAHT